MKMAIVIRKDLKISCGKAAAQAGHAAVECVMLALLEVWMSVIYTCVYYCNDYAGAVNAEQLLHPRGAYNLSHHGKRGLGGPGPLFLLACVSL